MMVDYTVNKWLQFQTHNNFKVNLAGRFFLVYIYIIFINKINILVVLGGIISHTQAYLAIWGDISHSPWTTTEI